MEDYKEKIKEIISKYYSHTVAENWEKEYFSTQAILEMVRGIIPTDPIGEHDVYEVMQELGYQIEKVDNVILWVLYRKNLLHI